MKQSLSIKVLTGAWKHAHEEDVQGVSVFRRANIAFAPSRGRLSFELRPDGVAIYGGLGAADAPTSEVVRWEISPVKKLTIYRNSRTIFQAEIVSVSKAKLALKIHSGD